MMYQTSFWVQAPITESAVFSMCCKALCFVLFNSNKPLKLISGSLISAIYAQLVKILETPGIR